MNFNRLRLLEAAFNNDRPFPHCGRRPSDPGGETPRITDEQRQAALLAIFSRLEPALLRPLLEPHGLQLVSIYAER